MNLKELITFQTIVSQGGFNKAASHLHFAQSTITSHIQRLEKDLGIQIFESGKSNQLTRAGVLFAQEVNQLIKHWEYVKGQVKFYDLEEYGVINIGLVEPLASRYFPNALKKFKIQKPNVTCNIFVGNTVYLANLLLGDDLDFAFCSLPEDGINFTFSPIYEEKIVAVLPTNHPLCAYEKVSLDKFKGYTLLKGGDGCPYRRRIESAIMGLISNPDFITINNISIVPYYVSENIGIGIMPLSLVPSSIPNITIRELDVENDLIPIGMLRTTTIPDLSFTKKMLCDFLIEEIKISE
ncbi:LysR family transcriptional regulator [Lysinibacillus agricola]|uniref:LysR family transcriptional regulator n=1 Tax=Lysinibacillus agricola TaxID=2590012 RepID=A0ABX7AVE7_9BACI|nr:MULTISPECIES: LysR family transcriptional regulator [Lysinibacillus]QQP13948.1 LysR family transcriptional regulator [Lysinibacillus agricola]